jgi:hypothetical protein
MQDLQQKLDRMDEPGKFRTIMEVPRAISAKAAIRCAESTDAPYLWQVISRNSVTYFKTLRQAQDYCRAKGWM